MTVQLTITRTSLSLPDLVITGDPAGDFWVPEDGLEEPDVAYRYTYAPDSVDIHGKVLLQAVKEHTSLSVQVYTQAASAAALHTNKETLAAALDQFTYTTQLLVDGQGYSWACDPTTPRWSAPDSGMVRAHLARASVVIPVYPIGA